MSLAYDSPGRISVDVELNELDRSVGSELANGGKPSDDNAHPDHDPVVGTARDQLRKFVKLRRKRFDDAEEIENLEVIRRGLAIGAPLSTELTIQVLEKPRCGPNRPPFDRH